MAFLQLFSVFLFTQVHAHFIIGELNGNKNCLRTINDPMTFPVEKDDFDNDVLKCNRGGWPTSAESTCPLIAGDKVTIQWYRNRKGIADPIVTPTHKGPCTVYLMDKDKKKNPDGKWFKVWHDGFSDGMWCTQKLIRDHGTLHFTLPSNVPPGDYILRGDAVALHVANHLERGAQFYVRCMDVTITGTNDGAKPSTDSLISIPGYFKVDSPGLYYNIYDKKNDHNKYPIPGPQLVTYVGGNGTDMGNSTDNGNSTNGDSGNPLNLDDAGGSTTGGQGEKGNEESGEQQTSNQEKKHDSQDKGSEKKKDCDKDKKDGKEKKDDKDKKGEHTDKSEDTRKDESKKKKHKDGDCDKDKDKMHHKEKKEKRGRMWFDKDNLMANDERLE